MILTSYLFKLPYTIIWHLLNYFIKDGQVVFYCGDPIDYYVFEPVNKELENINYVTDKRRVKRFFDLKNIKYKTLPVFPKDVIMARHATHKFPCSKIIKIGMRHGAYHFKKMTSADNYNEFNLYLMTSDKDVKEAEKIGVKVAKAVGFPKLDMYFNNKENNVNKKILDKIKIQKDKPIILFTATYDKSGMSAINKWFDKLDRLTAQYNVIVTAHSWVDRKYINTIKSNPNVHFIEEFDILPYINVSDVVIGDTSSILAECCALDKPIITFRTAKSKRSLDEIESIIDTISYRINSFEELIPIIEYALLNKSELSEARKQANEIFFDQLDGKAAQRAADEIKCLINFGD